MHRHAHCEAVYRPRLAPCPCGAVVVAAASTGELDVAGGLVVVHDVMRGTVSTDVIGCGLVGVAVGHMQQVGAIHRRAASAILVTDVERCEVKDLQIHPADTDTETEGRKSDEPTRTSEPAAYMLSIITGYSHSS